MSIDQLLDGIKLQEMQAALEFYHYYTEAISKDMKSMNNDGLLASLSVLEMDAGNRAKEALK